jgi:hypothetical protein
MYDEKPDATAIGRGNRFLKPGAPETATAIGRIEADRARMSLDSFKRITKGSLRGFATVRLPVGAAELIIADCPVNISHGKAWAALPSRPMLDRDGRHVEVDGKKKYVPFMAWSSRDVADKFSDKVVELVRERHPEALVEEGE